MNYRIIDFPYHGVLDKHVSLRSILLSVRCHRLRDLLPDAVASQTRGPSDPDPSNLEEAVR